MKTALLRFFTLFFLGLPFWVSAQTPFAGACPGGGFAVLAPAGTSDPSTLFTVDENTLALNSVGNTGVNLNALTYNRYDNLLYGLSDPVLSGTPTLYQVDATGTAFPVTLISPPTGGAIGAIGSFVGTMDADGIYYFPAIRVLGLFPITYEFVLGSLDLKVDYSGMASVSPNYINMNLDMICGTIIDNFVNAFLTAILTGGALPSGGIQDWAVNPDDGQIYSYLGIDAVVWKMDPITGVVECFNTGNAALTEFGAVLFDQNGGLKGIEVLAGNTWTVDINCPGASCGNLTAQTPFAGGLNGDAAACPFPEINLSVELGDFNAFATNDEIILEWETISEFQNSYFDIQKSTDGVQFENIGRLEGQGTTQLEHAYTFVDNNPVKGKNYYRLQQNDFDGRKDLSDVQVVDFGTTATIGLEIFPNPANTQIRIRMSQAFENETTFRLVNSVGQQVLLGTFAARQGFVDLQIDGLAPGVYFIELFDGERRATQKLIKK